MLPAIARRALRCAYGRLHSGIFRDGLREVMDSRSVCGARLPATERDHAHRVLPLQ
jgi:hypothetical protein